MALIRTGGGNASLNISFARIQATSNSGRGTSDLNLSSYQGKELYIVGPTIEGGQLGGFNDATSGTINTTYTTNCDVDLLVNRHGSGEAVIEWVAHVENVGANANLSINTQGVSTATFEIMIIG